VLGESAGCLTVRAILKAKQIADFIQAEAQLLCGFDERQPVYIGGTITSYTTGRALRLRQQPSTLVVPDRLDMYASRPGQTANRQDVRFMLHAP